MWHIRVTLKFRSNVNLLTFSLFRPSLTFFTNFITLYNKLSVIVKEQVFSYDLRPYSAGNSHSGGN